ncbi:GtrA family protein [Bacteroides sp.]|uniref:GtrA family protein n=1 Tax=Bacteroides sp. TaxID=29523 RepID=UPI001B547E9D|nr:GtrA family protein [Bacteroides sp.]MBP6064537.1 GtrA family protein [Bacteroides sp.]MBP6066698.1 GtrA family protein [Bacteroides sp.]MBP6935466.1 GtrA family protein [Bacteroides sp.]MBP9585340.1 GtrA family protein [Bacteroides sp.]
MFHNQRKWSEFIRYCIVGTIAAGVHYGIYYFLQGWINVNVAYTLGYTISFVGNFFLTAYLTFRTVPSFKRAFGFGSSHLVNYLLHMFLLNCFLYLNVSRVLAPLLVLAVAVPTNFLLLRWVFKPEKKPHSDVN